MLIFFCETGQPKKKRVCVNCFKQNYNKFIGVFKFKKGQHHLRDKLQNCFTLKI